jgi:hypothetical protein
VVERCLNSYAWTWTMRKNARHKVKAANECKALEKPGNQLVSSCGSHWVNFLFINKKTGRPYAGIKVDIKLPGESAAKDFKSNKNGIIGFASGVAEGTCEISSTPSLQFRNTLAIAGEKHFDQKSFTQDALGTEKSPLQKFPPSSTKEDFQAVAEVTRHVIKRGLKSEKLSEIANQYGVPVQELMSFNWGFPLRETYRKFNLDEAGIVFVPKKWEKKGLAVDSWHVFLLEPLEREDVIDHVIQENNITRRGSWSKRKLPDYEDLGLDWSYDTVVIHHTGNEITPTPEAIEKLHYEKNGWNEVGYHYIIDRKGGVYEGRSLMLKGSHVDSANSSKIGISLAGDFEHQWWDGSDDEVLDLQWNSLVKLINSLHAKFPSLEKVGGHRDYIVTKTSWTQKTSRGFALAPCSMDGLAL